MQANDAGDVKIRQLLYGQLYPYRQEMGHLGQPIDDDPNGIHPPGGSGKTGDKVHADGIPLPFWYRQRLK